MINEHKQLLRTASYELAGHLCEGIARHDRCVCCCAGANTGLVDGPGANSRLVDGRVSRMWACGGPGWLSELVRIRSCVRMVSVRE